MVIAMTRDEVCDLFNSNPCLTLPIIVETGSSVQGELEKRWDSFFEFLHRTEALYSCIEPAEYSREKITDAFKNYYAGDFGKASENLFDIVKTLIDKYRCKNLITDISSLYIGNESKNWFRARTGTFYPFSKDDMKHIPTDKREFIGSNRYSSNGIPCLYLANSILTCWEELNRPSLDSFWVSRFWPVKEIRVLNLSVTGYEIINAQQYIRTVSENKDAYDQVVVDFFSTWVLQSACSVAVRSKANRLFREEYLIPQLLMQNVKRFDANAIMYFSTKTPLLIGDKIPDSIRQIAMQGEFDEFDLNVFFSAKTEKNRPESAKFVYENEVQKWLDLIRGAYLPSNVDDLKLGQDKRPPMPYSDVRLMSVLTHTLWFLPNVASCYAMHNLLMQKQNNFYHEFAINVCAGTKAGIGLDALTPVERSMGNPLETKTITLSCGKLTTGVTIRPWTGVFMLRNLKSPETYFQTAFRVQSPWTIKDDSGNQEIIKKECYVFDFALDRALREISQYSCSLDAKEADPEKKVDEFIKFLPVLAYDGSSMKQVSAQDILDITLAGTSATLLARRWQSALLVNVDNTTLKRLMDSKDAMDALSRIEAFRSLNNDIQTIINKSEAVKKAKEKGEKPTPEEKKQISDAEKEFKSKRKEIQEKLMKFATRIPVFMFLTDYRERSLKDVITQLEPGLFKKVTGLDVKDFDLLCSLGVFNANLMNDAIFKFKRYEDASLSYTGIDKNADKAVGGWDTVLRREEYEKLFFNQQKTMKDAETPSAEGVHPFTDKPGKKGQDAKTAAKPVSVTAPIGKKSTAVSVLASTTPVKPKKLDIPEVTVGMVAMHKKFGKGTISNIDKAGKHLRVKFAEGGEKAFIYPDAFVQGFLTLEKGE